MSARRHDDEHDDREWVQVEVTWDEGHDDEPLDWDANGWALDPLFDPRPLPPRPPYPLAERRDWPPQPFESQDQRRRERRGPKRKQPSPGLTRRKQKRLRAWEIEEDEG